MRSGSCHLADTCTWLFVAHRHARTSGHSAERLNLCLSGKELLRMLHLLSLSYQCFRSPEFEGIRWIASIQTRKKKILITKLETSKQRGEALPTYSRNPKKICTQVRAMKKKNDKDREARLEHTCDHADDDKNIEDDEQDRHIPEFTMKELRIAIGSLKKGTSADRPFDQQRNGGKNIKVPGEPQ